MQRADIDRHHQDQLDDSPTSEEEGGATGIPFDPGKLARILAALEKRGVTVLMGMEGARMLQALHAKALYFPAEGGPGTLVFGPSPSRAEVIEELLHLGQYRSRGWPTTNGNPRLRLELELEAQDRLLALGARRGWTEGELNTIKQACEVWKHKLRRLEGST